MANLLAERQNVFWHDYKVIVAAGTSAGMAYSTQWLQLKNESLLRMALSF